MNVGFSPINFNGQIRLKNPEYWTDAMKKALSENKSVQAKLVNNDIIGEIAAKKETKYPPGYARHSIGDLLYRMEITVQSEEKMSFLDKLKHKAKINPKAKTYIINRHYHSEQTTVERLQNLELD